MRMARAFMKISRAFTPLGQLAPHDPHNRHLLRRTYTPSGSLNISFIRPSKMASFAPGYIGFTACLGKERTDRLAHPASHTDDKLFFKFSHEICQRFHSGFKSFQLFYLGSRCYLDPGAALICRPIHDSRLAGLLFQKTGFGGADAVLAGEGSPQSERLVEDSVNG